jgi:exodeoxyribonuclease V gamma subunit
MHRAAVQAQLIAALSKAEVGSLPERVAIFGAPALPPSLLQLYSAVARHADVHLFLQNPSREYWGDIASAAHVARRAITHKAEAAYLQTGNSLLASLGQQGRDFIDLVTENESAVVQEWYEEAGDACLLHAIQSDVLDLRENGPDTPRSIENDDSSVQIHCCHGAMREVEVLHDQLLALFEAHRDLEPADVVVMTPDVETYAPYIEAVFATAEPRIPYNISDRTAEHESTLTAAFMTLLDLPGSRYEANAVLALLDEPAVRRRYGFAEADLETVHRWVRESCIRWGMDGAHRARLGLPPTHEHTWRYGLDRLLLGYAMPGGNEQLFEGILPYDEVEGSLGVVLGRFQSYAENAMTLDDLLRQPRTMSQWIALLHGVLARFFDADAEHEHELEAVRGALNALAAEAAAARYGDVVPLAVIKSALRARLDVPGRAFLSGGVTFCAMVPMRSLPFEVVCMIGMNDGAYPRIQHPYGFDLMAQGYRKGDRSRRDDDRYLFLESLLSARRCLYVSYTGRNIRDDTIIPPSVLVSELIDYIANGYSRADGSDIRAHLLTVHPLQAFSRRYFDKDDRLFTYSHALSRAARAAVARTSGDQPFLPEPLPEPPAEARTIDLETLIRFFRNPSKFLLSERLKIRIEAAAEEIDTREPFALEGLAAYGLRQHLLDMRLRGHALDGYPVARAGGVLPHGTVGAVLFSDESAAIDRYAEALQPLLPRSVFDPVAFEIESQHVRLRGTLAPISVEGLVGYRAAKLTPADRVRAWIRHLVLNAIAPEGVALTSRWIAQDCIATFAPVADAQECLAELLELYWSGLTRPLPFFVRTACEYATTGEITSKVRSAWLGGFQGNPPGEGDDAYHRLAFRGIDPLDTRFEQIAMTVYGPMKAAMQEMPLS